MSNFKYAGPRAFVVGAVPSDLADYTITTINKSYASAVDRVRDITNKIIVARLVVLDHAYGQTFLHALCVELDKPIKWTGGESHEA